MAWYNPLSWGDESSSARTKRNNIDYQGQEASGFANEGQDAFAAGRGELSPLTAALTQRANGQGLLSTEQLRQGLNQNVGAQRSFAASAAPANAPMAARTAAIQTGRLGAGFAGQAAEAAIRETQAAQQTLGELLLRKRQQELEAALGSRQNATSAFGGITPEGSPLEKALPAVNAGIGLTGVILGRGKGK